MKETNFQSRFGGWVSQSDDFLNNSFELKLVNTQHHKSLNPINDFQPQQLPQLLQAKHIGLYYKYSDMSSDLKPYDCHKIKGPAYVVVMYWRKGARDQTFHMVDIDDFIWLMMTHKKPYFKEHELAEISTQYSF